MGRVDKLTKERIKEYLKRLGTDEELASVRADFVKEFEAVDAAEIMSAEQELLREGTPLSEVQRLCDVYVVFFQERQRRSR